MGGPRKARRTATGHGAGAWVADNANGNANLYQPSAPFNFGETAPQVVGDGDLLSPYIFHHQSKDVQSDGYYGPFPAAAWAAPFGEPKPPNAPGQALPLAYQLEPLLLNTSPVGSTVSGSSGELSPVQTDNTSCFSLSDVPVAGPSWARVPSPLRHLVPTEEQRAPARGKRPAEPVPGPGGGIPQEKSAAEPGQPAFPHVCRWNENGPCRSSGFSTRDELNCHVKTEHLLECPVLGCVEGAFQTKDLLACHIRCAHERSLKRPARCLLDGAPGDTAKEVSRLHGREQGSHPAPTRTSADDKKLKEAMSIATSKRKCCEKLRSVMEKKSRKVNAGRSSWDVGSPGIVRRPSPRPVEQASFPIVWEHGVLPFLIEFMPRWCGPGHVISVVRGKKPGTRRISITTKKLSRARKVTIAGHVRDLLPESYRQTVTFVFSVGEVDRLTWARGLSRQMPDEVCAPRNPFYYISPCMGDSIGATLPDGDDVSATLGPNLVIGGGNYWLANFHPFVETNIAGDAAFVEHPSPADRDSCLQERHDALDNRSAQFKMGKIAATSGYDLSTTRITHETYWEDCDKEPPLIVTDWVLISAQKKEANLLRKFPSGATPKKEVPVTRMSSVVPGVDVCSTGRTSGHQRGQVCEIPAYIDGAKAGNTTGKGTREWFIEEPESCDDEDGWIRGGIGVQGDSGAAIVDCETNALMGQLWGRNKYYGPGPRLTFFTPIFDIFDDIQERCAEPTRPQLPQYLDEAGQWPVYPVCRQCFDRRVYLDSRRSSRESLVSMIAGAGDAAQSDHDFLSVSELATPKAGGDHAHWARYANLDDALASPAAFVSSSMSLGLPASSPGMMDIRSPYPIALHDEDFYEPRCPDDGYAGLGKRAAASAPMARSVSHQPGKRRRIM